MDYKREYDSVVANYTEWRDKHFDTFATSMFSLFVASDATIYVGDKAACNAYMNKVREHPDRVL
jgi:hypothetical protein